MVKTNEVSGCGGAVQRDNNEENIQRWSSPVLINASHCLINMSNFPSSTGHVEARVNLRGPPRKAKYSLVTDSELVPRGKAEKSLCKSS